MMVLNDNHWAVSDMADEMSLPQQWDAFCAQTLPPDLQERWNKWFSVALRGQAEWPADVVDGEVRWRDGWSPDV